MTDPTPRVYRSVLPIVIILALGAFLMLFHLDHRPFWQDEAETAGLAKNVLKYGVPRAYDGVNVISQEEGHEFDQNYLWRWSPWLQIYVAAAAFKIGGLTTYAGRFPFAVLGIVCIFLVYRLVRHNFGNWAWACLAALLLSTSVVFLLHARQCRYYSLGTCLVLLSLLAFRDDWQTKIGPALLLCISLGLLFYANYLLFLSFVVPAFLAAILLYHSEMPLARTLKVIAGTCLIIFPGLFLFRLQQQTTMISLGAVREHLRDYSGDFFQFMFPLPVTIYMLWHWFRALWTRSALFKDPAERYILFLGLIVLGNILILTLAPQSDLRYLVHLYPLCAIVLGWVIWRTWRFHKFSGALLCVLLVATNWLYVLPLKWFRIIEPPMHNDPHKLTFPNIPLQLYLAELSSPYPDVNQQLIRFFKTQAQPGDIILTTYGDLPLQFYTSCQVIGGLQGHIPPTKLPRWLVQRWFTRWNREYDLNDSEQVVRRLISQPGAYQPITLPGEDEAFGNYPNPYYHRFKPPSESFSPLVIYEKNSSAHAAP